MLSIFISSPANEFKEERIKIKKFIEENSILNQIFEVFVFEEDVVATGKQSDEIYLEKARNSDIYLGLIGESYGNIRSSGFSATEEEFNSYYNNGGKHALFFIKDCENRDLKTEKFIDVIGNKVVYNTFNGQQDLLNKIEKALAGYINETHENISFDERIVPDSSENDLDKESYNLFLKESNMESQDFIKILSNKFNVLVKDRDTYKFTTAGALFFTENPNKFDGIDAGVKLARFDGTDKTIFIDKATLNGSLLKILNEIESFFKRNTRYATKIIGFERYDIPEYPYDAVREAIINAIAHRDYEIKGTDVTFFIYDDRIEIISPGNLKFPLTLNNLEDGNSVRRNEIICNLFHHTKYMEQYGTGIERIKTKMIEHGLPAPKFELNGNFFKVILYGPGENILKLQDSVHANKIDLKKYDLNDRQYKLLEILSQNNENITNKEYRKLFEVSRSTAARDLRRLVELNLIQKYEINGKEVIYSIK